METTTETSEQATTLGFKVEVEVSAKDVASLICSGFEGGMTRHWCRIMDYQEPESVHPVLDDSQVFRHTDYPLLEGGAVICRLYEEETDDEFIPLVLDRNTVQRGLLLMARKYPSHWADFLNERSDAVTGDVFLQCCLLGDLIYG